MKRATEQTTFSLLGLTPQVGHIRHPRAGMPWVYIGRTMRAQGLVDRGWGNPFREGHNSDDAVDDYDRYLDTRPALLARLPELVGHDLLCWCRLPRYRDPVRYPNICHGDPLRRRVQAWEREHPAEAAAIIAALPAEVLA